MTYASSPLLSSSKAEIVLEALKKYLVSGITVLHYSFKSGGEWKWNLMSYYHNNPGSALLILQQVAAKL